MRAVLLSLAALLAGTPARAQSRFSLDVSGGATRHQFAAPGTAWSLTPRWSWGGNPARLDAGFTYTRGTAMQWNAEGGARGSLGARLGGGLSFAMAAEGWWTAHRIGDGTGQVSLLPAIRVDNLWGSELTFEGGAGHASTANGGRWFGLLGARGRWLTGPFDLAGRIQHTRFNQRTLRWGSAWNPARNGSDTLATPDTLSALRNYSDLGLTIGWSGEGTRMELTIEQRFGGPEFRAFGWHLEGSTVIAPRLALFASAGETLSALNAGLPARRYTALGVRWAPGRGKPPGFTDRSNGRGVRLDRLPDATSRLAVRAGSAATVEVMGDFTDWEPVSLIPEGDGWWVLPRVMQPGLYRLNLRADRGLWRVPLGLPSEADEFGGRVGVLLVK